MRILNFNKAFEAALAGIRAEKDGSFPLGDYFEETAATNFGKLFLGKRSDIPPATFDELYKLVKNASVRIEPQYFELLDILTDKQKIKLALVVKNETDPNRLVNIILDFYPYFKSLAARPRDINKSLAQI